MRDRHTETVGRRLYEWVRDYTGRALDAMKGPKARTGNEWVTDEMVVRVGGQRYWLWNLLDSKTQYILAAHHGATPTPPVRRCGRER